MHIPDKTTFQPSKEALLMWLETRKPRHRVGSLTVPAFLSDSGRSSDQSWFIFGVFGEIVGLVTTVYAGARAGGVFVLISIVAIVLFILCDIFFARLLHRKKALQCRLEAEIEVAAVMSTAEASLRAVMRRGRVVDFFLQLGIILIAILKALGIFLLGVFPNPGIYVPFLIIFLMVAYVHINHTGYCWAYWKTQRMIDNEHEQVHISNKFSVKEARELVETPTPLNNVPISYAPHVIQQHAAGNQDQHSYVIVASGVLTDDEILSLIGGQTAANQVELFKGCRRLQLSTVPSPQVSSSAAK